MAWRGIVSCLVAVLVVVFGIFAYYYLAGDINIPIQGEALWVVIIIGICLVLTVVFSVGMAWSVLRTCSPEDDKRPPTKAGKGHRGEPFHSDGRPTLVRDMKEIVAVARFVGLIEIRNGIKTTSSGTGFLVADGYLMSAYHVFKERIESPDLNPIEMVWNQMKRYVAKQEPTTKDQLIQCIQEFWHKCMTKEQCNIYIDHMFKVVPVCVVMKGQATADHPNRIFCERSRGKSISYFQNKLHSEEVSKRVDALNLNK